MKKKNIVILALFLVAIIAVVMLLVVLMKDETKTNGLNPDNVVETSLVCESQNISYPFFDYDKSKKKNLKVSAIFHDDKLNAISLTYTLFYDSASEIESSEAHNHADMNISFSRDGLDPDMFNAHYSKMTDSLKMDLYASSNDINQITAKYFIINLHNDSSVPQKLNEYYDLYKNQNFICKSNN